MALVVGMQLYLECQNVTDVLPKYNTQIPLKHQSIDNMPLPNHGWDPAT